MTERHRIGFLSGDWLDFGGVETHLLSIFKLLDQTRFESLLIAPASEHFVRRVEASGAKYIPLNTKNVNSLEKISSLQNIFREEKISLIHIHSPGIALEARIAARLTGRPAVVTVHLPSSAYFLHTTLKQKIKFLLYSVADWLLNYTLTERIIYVSGSAYAQAMSLKYAPRTYTAVIPNGVALSLANPNEINIRQQLSIPRDRIILCFIGRLEPQKRLDVLIRALGLIPESVLEKLELWIVGAGSLAERLEAFVKSLGLQNRVRFLGYQEDVGHYLDEADIFVLPSQYEAMSISLLEAMAHGLPCIVTNTGENHHLITHGVEGFTLPTGNADLLSFFLITLVNDSELRKDMGISARVKASAFSENEMVSKINSIYWVAIQRWYRDQR